MASTFVTTGLGYLFWMVVARYFRDDEPVVSLGTTLVTAMTLLTLISRLGLDASLVRFLPKSDRQKEMINSCFTINIILSIIAASIFIFVIGFWVKDLSFIRNNVFFAVSFILFTVVLSIAGSIMKCNTWRSRKEPVMLSGYGKYWHLSIDEREWIAQFKE
jgi:O-antigen/teichoic acid export membrane protein